MTPDAATALFTRSDGQFRFARWGRPIAPVVFGTDDATLPIIKGAIREVASLGDLAIVDTDPEFGANLLVFFVESWSDLADVPNLDRLVPDMAGLLGRLEAAQANQYRTFRFDDQGAISLCIILLRMDDVLSGMPAQALMALQMVQSMLLWSDTAFRSASPVATVTGGGHCVARPEIAALIRAAYDPVLPPCAQDPSHMMRVAARAQLLLGDLADDA